MDDVTVDIYTKFGCGYCFRAKRLLDTTERILNYKVRGYGIDVRRFKSPEFGRRGPGGPLSAEEREQVGA